jgi:hypothetical protein
MADFFFFLGAEKKNYDLPVSAWLLDLRVIFSVIKPDWQCTYKRNIGARFFQRFLQWKSNKHYIFWVCVCSLSFPACNALEPYCHLWSAPLYSIFPHYLKNARFSKKVTEINLHVLIPSSNVSVTFLIIIRTERDITKNVYCSTCEVLVILVRF